MYVVFYTVRLPHGKKDQLWCGGVYLHDRWEIAETIKEAEKIYAQVIEREEVHCGGISKILESTDW